MENSTIPWCNHTFNPWEGCTMCSPGCFNCYALARNKRFAGGANWGKGAPRRRTELANWRRPLRWNKEATDTQYAHASEAPLYDPGHFAAYERPRVFCASLADWLDDEVPIEWLADLLDLIRLTPHLDWLLLTKRPQNWNLRIEDVLRLENYPDPKRLETQIATRGWLIDWIKAAANYGGSAPDNVWIGTTVEDQTRADERLPLLLSIPAKVRFLSCEPLLSDLDLSEWLFPAGGRTCGIDWIICGCESGPGRRSMSDAWARDLAQAAKYAGVAFFMKQMVGGGKVSEELADFPPDLQIRQFPEARQRLSNQGLDGK